MYSIYQMARERSIVFPVRVSFLFYEERTDPKSIDGGLALRQHSDGHTIRRKSRIFGSQWEIMRNCGMNGAGIMHLAAVLHSIVHELSHYFQWLKNRNEWEMADKKTMNAPGAASCILCQGNWLWIMRKSSNIHKACRQKHLCYQWCSQIGS